MPVAGTAAQLGLNPHPTRIYLRADPDQAPAVADVLPFTASSAQPEAVEVRRPSDVLQAGIAARRRSSGCSSASVPWRCWARARHVAVQFFLESALRRRHPVSVPLIAPLGRSSRDLMAPEYGR
jgi:hypothetical protein